MDVIISCPILIKNPSLIKKWHLISSGEFDLNIKDIDTPALVIDLDIMENNIKTVAEFFKARKCNLRPHVKFCKTPIIAYKMLKAGGAKGICTAKLSEAEMMASVGIDDIFELMRSLPDRK